MPKKCVMNGLWKLPSNYSKTVIPPDYNPSFADTNNSNMTFEVYVRDITRIDEKMQKVQISMYFETGWREDRLILSNLEKWNKGIEDTKYINIDPACLRENFLDSSPRDI